MYMYIGTTCIVSNLELLSFIVLIIMGDCVCDKCVYERERNSRMCARRM